MLHVRMLLLRPILSDVLNKKPANEPSNRTSSRLSSSVADQCALTCVTTALESIRIIHQELSSPLDEARNLSAWYHNVLYLYTSTTILVCKSMEFTSVANVYSVLPSFAQ
jgi:hypothetical protein